ncbi:MAG: hydroxyacid dehydrogenase [Planctomycetota bacterium]
MHIVIADKYPANSVQQLRDAGCQVTLAAETNDAALKDTLRKTGCSVLVVRSRKVTRDVLLSTPTLRMVIRAGSGTDTIDVDAANEFGVRVCNCPGTNSVAVAELTFGLMIALDRRIVDETDDLRRGIWNKKEYGKAKGLKGSTLGIVGLGRIGQEVAKRARAFEMNILYFDPLDRATVAAELGAKQTTLVELLGASDFVTLHVPGGGETRHMIGERELGLMKRNAFLINCSRGGIVDEEALSHALETGQIAGAALDVFEIEPGANDTEFLNPVGQVPHLYGTHHVGASTEQAQSAVAEEVAHIIGEFMNKGEFLHCVNPPEFACMA